MVIFEKLTEGQLDLILEITVGLSYTFMMLVLKFIKDVEKTRRESTKTDRREADSVPRRSAKRRPKWRWSSRNPVNKN